MELVFWLAGFGVMIACATVFLVVRARRARRLPGDHDASIPGERSHSEAIAAAHTAGAARSAH
ncbi:hypothetical protein JOE59_001285 [Agromyces cerinus]|uniref:hypothetical protein n=1 Tax=Agromyces cerinus TaxID=33878 RepID=UPI00195BF6AB|nr:hypothetical protein [Agromyces cerinus]MBM7830580.1 hypothetical protein [Agromyces cerinus]